MPAAIQEASGAWQKDPQRRRSEPKAGGVGPAPEGLPDDERAIWDEIVSECAPGVFQSSDRKLLEHLSRLIAQSRRNPDPKYFGSRSYAILLSMLSRCGMTPSDRSRVCAPSTTNAAEKPKTGLASFRR